MPRFPGHGPLFALLAVLGAAPAASAQSFNPPPPDLIQTGGHATIDGTGVSGDSQFLFFSATSDPSLTEFGQVATYADSVLTVGGGAAIDTLDTLGASHVTLSGGTVSQINTFGASLVEITGGVIGSFTSQQFPGFLIADDSSTIDLFGVGLTLKNGLVTGTLADGTAIRTRFSSAGGRLLFNGAVPGAVPEASTAFSLGLLLLLGAGALTVAARRKTGARV